MDTLKKLIEINMKAKKKRKKYEELWSKINDLV